MLKTLNNLGLSPSRKGNTEEALFYFNKVFQYNKNYGKAYNNVGLVMMKGGQKGLAEEYFRKSMNWKKMMLILLSTLQRYCAQKKI